MYIFPPVVHKISGSVIGKGVRGCRSRSRRSGMWMISSSRGSCGGPVIGENGIFSFLPLYTGRYLGYNISGF
jgi:hypothetical protein